MKAKSKEDKVEEMSSFLEEQIGELDKMYLHFREAKQEAFEAAPELPPKAHSEFGELEELILAKTTVRRERRRHKLIPSTKNKPKPTQALLEQVNSYIDLAPSCETRQQEVQKIMDATKKKKKMENQGIRVLLEDPHFRLDRRNSWEKQANIQAMKDFQQTLLEARYPILQSDDSVFVPELGSLVQEAYSKSKPSVSQPFSFVYHSNEFLAKIEE